MTLRNPSRRLRWQQHLVRCLLRTWTVASAAAGRADASAAKAAERRRTLTASAAGGATVRANACSSQGLNGSTADRTTGHARRAVEREDDEDAEQRNERLAVAISGRKRTTQDGGVAIGILTRNP